MNKTEASEWWLDQARCGPSIDEAGNECLAPKVSTLCSKGETTLTIAGLSLAASTLMSLLFLVGSLIDWSNDVFASEYLLPILGWVVVYVLVWANFINAYHWASLGDTMRRPDVYGLDYSDISQTEQVEEPTIERVDDVDPVADFEGYLVDAAGNPI